MITGRILGRKPGKLKHVETEEAPNLHAIGKAKEGKDDCIQEDKKGSMPSW